MPRLGNVRLSVKLGLCFGAILALTAAIVAVNLVNIAALESAHERVTTGVVPRIMAAQHADTAFPKRSHEAQYVQTLRATVDQIADKPESVFSCAIAYFA